MKICLVSPYDYPYPGGVTEQVKGLEKYLRQRGHQVTILAPSSDEDEEHLPGNVHRVGDVIEIPANGSRARISLSLSIGRTARDILTEEGFDVIHLHEPLMPMVPLLVLRQSPTCNVGTFHAYGDDSLAYAAARPVLRSYVERLHGRIAVSTAARDYVSQYFPGDYRIIPNGVDVPRFATPQPPIARYRDGRPTILFVGRFGEQRKGFRTFLQALPLLLPVLPDLRVVVVGKGDPGLYTDLLPGQPGVVEFAGYASADDLPRYYQSCDVYCAPSTGGESFGVVLLEAMAAGAPVVASRNAGYAAVLTHGQEGFLVEPRSPEGLAVALARVLGDGSLRQAMAAQGRRTAARYDWPLVGRAVEAYYDESRQRFLVEGSGGRPWRRRLRAAATWTGSSHLWPLPGDREQNLDRATARLGDLLGGAPEGGPHPWRRGIDSRHLFMDAPVEDGAPPGERAAGSNGPRTHAPTPPAR